MGAPFPCPGWVVVTGAGRGFGRALALEFARAGCDVLATDQDAAAAEKTAALALDAGAGRTRSAACDVTQRDDWDRLAALIGGERVGTLVNNAGVACGGRVGEVAFDEWRWSLDVNFFGAVRGCDLFVPIMRRQRSGHIVNVSSAGGFLNLPGAAAYSAAKAAVISLSETLAVELDGSGVRISVVCPTFIRTGIVESGRFADEAAKKNAGELAGRGRDAAGTARETFRLLRAGGFLIIPFAEGKMLHLLKRCFPRTYLFLLRVVSKAHQKKAEVSSRPVQ